MKQTNNIFGKPFSHPKRDLFSFCFCLDELVFYFRWYLTGAGSVRGLGRVEEEQDKEEEKVGKVQGSREGGGLGRVRQGTAAC